MRLFSPLVVILTWCGDIEALYGSLLTFQTLRVGFPEQEVVVIDNGSVPEAVPHIAHEAAMVGAKFFRQQPLPHHLCIRQALFSVDRPLVFVDPDVVFWQRMPIPDADLAGRLIPTFADEYTGTRTQARLHTSLLMTRPGLRERIAEIERKYFDADVLRPVMVPTADGWVRYDTAAVLYAEIGGHAFTPAELDCYEHLFCGSHLSVVAPTLNDESRKAMIDSHDKARRGDLASLRGLWRQQQAHFEARAA